MSRAGPFSRSISPCWLTVTCGLGASWHKGCWGAIPASGPYLHMWHSCLRGEQSKLEFGTLRQTENIPFHHGHVSTNVIYLYTIYFCWIWPALSARVLDQAAVKINWNFNYCCLLQVSMPIIGSYWTHWNPKCYRKTIYDFLTLLHPVTAPHIASHSIKKVSEKLLPMLKVRKCFATYTIMSHTVKQHVEKLLPHVNYSRFRE